MRYSINFVKDPAEVFRKDTNAPINNQNLQLVIKDAASNLNGLVGWRIF